MRSFKKTLATVLMTTMVMTIFAACSQNSSGDEMKSNKSAFPEKQVTIIMPWSLGGGPDTIARQIASYGEKYLGVPVIVENKTGGAGTIAMAAAMQAKDDGYSLVVANGPLFSLTPSFQNVNYTIDDITPLIGMREVEFVVLSNPDKSGISTLDDLKSYSDSGKTIKYATTGGPGNDSYTMISVLFKKLGFAAEAVPYDGGQDAINALVGGHVDIAIGSPPVYRDYVREGTLTALGTFIPDGIEVEGIGRIPSFNEQGIDVEFIGMDYFAVLSTVDEEKQQILTDFIAQVYMDEDFQKFMADLGMSAWSGTEKEILEKIDNQTVAMEEYISLLK